VLVCAPAVAAGSMTLATMLLAFSLDSAVFDWATSALTAVMIFAVLFAKALKRRVARAAAVSYALAGLTYGFIAVFPPLNTRPSDERQEDLLRDFSASAASSVRLRASPITRR